MVYDHEDERVEPNFGGDKVSSSSLKFIRSRQS